MKRVSLKVLIAAAISLVSFLLTATICSIIGRDAVGRLELEIGRSLALLSDEAQDKLDRSMFERLQALSSLVNVGEIPRKVSSPDDLRATLRQFQADYADYSWVGYADGNGTIIGATGGALEGHTAKNQPWFVSGLKEPFVGEVKLREPRPGVPATAKDHGLPNFIDLSVPVMSGERAVGVLGATLSADWAEEVKDTLLGNMKQEIPADVIVLDQGRRVLLGPDDLMGKTLDLPSIRAAKEGSADYAVETWSDGLAYLTGFSKSDGYRSYPGLKWIVLVREDIQTAFAPVSRLRNTILLAGAALSILAAALAWALADRLSQPLLQLSDAAERLRLGERMELPQVDGYDEARVLSRSFRSLVNELEAQKSSLASANQTLESQVRERTQRLAEQNVGLEKAKGDAERATEAKSRFLAAASHDLRQPLHALTLFARALSRRVQGDEATTLVAQMEEGLRGLKGMFDALLNVSRLDARLIEPSKHAVSIAEIIDRISVGSKVEAEQNGLRFISRPQNWIIETDPALLETIIRNFVSNALKFTRQGGVILAARQRDGKRVVDVYDTGPGFALEQHDRIFEEFSRTELRAKGQNDGLGLGLSIARRYAELLGMKIYVLSESGRGSRFTIELPESAMRDELPDKVHIQREDIDLRGVRILVLDDDPLIVAALSRDLNDRSNVVFGFDRITEAERALANGLKIDAAVLDFDLRGTESGLEFIQRMSGRLGRPIPAVVLSGGTDSATMAILARSGRPWLTKPADPELIVASLSAVLHARAAYEEVTHRISV